MCTYAGKGVGDIYNNNNNNRPSVRLGAFLLLLGLITYTPSSNHSSSLLRRVQWRREKPIFKNGQTELYYYRRCYYTRGCAATAAAGVRRRLFLRTKRVCRVPADNGPVNATAVLLPFIIIVITVYCYQTRFPFRRFMTAAPAGFHYRACPRDDRPGDAVWTTLRSPYALSRRIEWTKWLLVRDNRCEKVFAFPRVHIAAPPPKFARNLSQSVARVLPHNRTTLATGVIRTHTYTDDRYFVRPNTRQHRGTSVVVVIVTTRSVYGYFRARDYATPERYNNNK